MNFSLQRACFACLLVAAHLVAQPANADASRASGYLTGASNDHAADYLAFLIRIYGCEVHVDDRPAFNTAITRFIARDFGIDPGADTEESRAALRAIGGELFGFSFRAGPLLVERGELSIDDDGTARLTQCNNLTS